MNCHFTPGRRVVNVVAVSSSCVLFAVFAMTMANATVFATVGLFGRAVGLSEFQVGTIFVSSAVLFLLTSARWGVVADRWGRRPVIVIGLAATAVSLFLFAGVAQAAGGLAAGALATFVALLGARTVYGLFAGGTQPAAIAAMADATTADTRSAGVARVGAAIGLGSIAGPLSVAALIDFGVAVPLIAGGLVSSLAAVVVVAGGRETSRAPATRSRPRGSSSTRLGPFLVLAFVMHFAFAALQPTNAFYIQDLLGVGTTRAMRLAGLVSATFAACSFVVQAFVVARLGFRPRRLLAVGLVLCLAGLVACLLAPTFDTLLAGFGLLGIGFGFAQPGLVAGASLAAGERQAEAAGLLQAAMSAAWIGGALAGTGIYGLSIVGPLALAALGILGALLVAAFPRPEVRAEEPDSRSIGRTRLL
jgi:MFS family permease